MVKTSGVAACWIKRLIGPLPKHRCQEHDTPRLARVRATPSRMSNDHQGWPIAVPTANLFRSPFGALPSGKPRNPRTADDPDTGACCRLRDYARPGTPPIWSMPRTLHGFPRSCAMHRVHGEPRRPRTVVDRRAAERDARSQAGPPLGGFSFFIARRRPRGIATWSPDLRGAALTGQSRSQPADKLVVVWCRMLVKMTSRSDSCYRATESFSLGMPRRLPMPQRSASNGLARAFL